MPDGPTRSVTLPKGFRAAGGTCGIKASGKPDLALIVADRRCAAAGVFTRNKVLGAPVIVAKRHLGPKQHGRARAIVCNSGNSNVATGHAGVDDAIAMCQAAAKALRCDPGEVLPCSTGIIGRPLPMGKIIPGIRDQVARLHRGSDADREVATAILTTDLTTKAATRTVTLDGQKVHLGGVCKGSGMIAPNLATMLAFITTDADVTPAVLHAALQEAVRASFNRVTVDTDTSTSDAVLVLASGAAGNPAITKSSGDAYDAFRGALTELCHRPRLSTGEGRRGRDGRVPRHCPRREDRRGRGSRRPIGRGEPAGEVCRARPRRELGPPGHGRRQERGRP